MIREKQRLRHDLEDTNVEQKNVRHTQLFERRLNLRHLHSEVVHDAVTNAADEAVLLVEGARVVPPVLLATDAQAHALESFRHGGRVEHVRVLVELLRVAQPGTSKGDVRDTSERMDESGWKGGAHQSP